MGKEKGLAYIKALAKQDLHMPGSSSRMRVQLMLAGESAIAIAARQPTMRFVPIKTVEQQTILCWHRARAGFNGERTALINRLRGPLAEFGITIAQSSDRLLKACPAGGERLPPVARCCWKQRAVHSACAHRALRCRDRCACA
jgi:transposase